MPELRLRFSRLLVLAAAAAALSGAAFAQNQLVNPDFDQDAAGWFAPAGTISWAADEDADGCVGSGAARVSGPEIVAGERTLELTSDGSCADVEPNQLVHLHIRLFPVVSGASTDLMLLTYTDDECTVGETEAGIAGYGALPSSWINLMVGLTVQGTVESARVLVRTTDPSLTTLETLFDRIYLGISEPVFRDDFEAGAVCRWSSVGG